MKMQLQNNRIYSCGVVSVNISLQKLSVQRIFLASLLLIKYWNYLVKFIVKCSRSVGSIMFHVYLK